MKTFYEIPKIDLSSLINSNENLIDLAQQIYEIYTKIGFAYIENHGVSEDLITSAFRASTVFHNLPLEEKNKIKQNKFFRGYMGIEASILKVSTLGVAKTPNQSEAFIMAHEVSNDDPDFLIETNLAGPNQWPENMPEFKKTILEYYDGMLNLSMKLVKVFSLAFGLNNNFLDHLFDKPTTFLRLQYYPEQPKQIPKEQYGIAPHTDYGFLTILAQDDIGGLQVKNTKGDWIEVPPVPGTFILNSGDMLKRLTNDAFISTPHRVINYSGKKRYSIPFFLEPNMHATIEPLLNFCSPTNPAKYLPMKYHEHLMKRIRGNYEIGA